MVAFGTSKKALIYVAVTLSDSSMEGTLLDDWHPWKVKQAGCISRYSVRISASATVFPSIFTSSSYSKQPQRSLPNRLKTLRFTLDELKEAVCY
ncbi:hypothetical protein EJB05_47356, partial [Eragrostis curvula]